MAMFTTKVISPDLQNGPEIETTNISADNFRSVFEIDRCVNWIIKNGFMKVCLQFPDHLLFASADVASCFEEELGFKVYILCDGTYGSCCVDEITAQHVGADAVIHFGHYCLSPSVCLPVLHIFEKKPIDISSFVSNMKETFTDPYTKILLLYDVAFKHSIDAITPHIVDSYPHLVISKLVTDTTSPSDCQSILGRVFNLEAGTEIDEYKVVFIGPEGHCLETLMHAMAGCRFFVFDPVNHQTLRDYQQDSGKFHRKRMYLIEKVKHAKTIGILIGTLSVASYGAAVDRIKSLAKAAGKKCYIIAVGKPNVAKLANFSEVEVFVLVACPESSLLDSKEFFQPVVTMHEVELSLNPGHVWSEKHITDFRTLLPGGSNYVPEEDAASSYETSDVSLIDGRLHHLSLESEESQMSSAVSLRKDLTVSNSVTSHGLNLSSRSWIGLEQNLGMTEVLLSVPGRKGIPQKYTHEQHPLVNGNNNYT